MIADTLTDSLARLTGDEQKAVKTTTFDLLNPASPGMSYHRLGKARDKGFGSVRAGSDRAPDGRQPAALLRGPPRPGVRLGRAPEAPPRRGARAGRPEALFFAGDLGQRIDMGGYAATRTTPKLPLDTVERLGYRLVIFPLAVVRAGVRAMVDFLAGLAARGTEFEVEHIAGLRGHPVESWYEFSGIREIRALEERYLPAQAVAQKYAGGQGYRP